MNVDWTDCLYRPSLCGEREEDEKELMRELKKRVLREPPLPHEPPQTAVPRELFYEQPQTPHLPQAVFSPVRRKGLLFSSYWQVVNTPYAEVGDVVVVKSSSEYFVLRQVKRPDLWMEPSALYYIAGDVERRFCIYGFVLGRDMERIAAELRSGRYALVAACDPRVLVKPPSREELYVIWRYEGYIINASPAKMTLIKLNSKKPKFAVDYLRKGCPIYSQHLNQILNTAGIPIQLAC